MILLCHNFVYLTTVELSWYVQNCGLMRSIIIYIFISVSSGIYIYILYIYIYTYIYIFIYVLRTQKPFVKWISDAFVNSSPPKKICPPFWQTTISNSFLCMKTMESGSNLAEICSHDSNWLKASICSGNGLASNRRQAITLTNADQVHWRIYAAQGSDESNQWRHMAYRYTVLAECSTANAPAEPMKCLLQSVIWCFSWFDTQIFCEQQDTTKLPGKCVAWVFVMKSLPGDVTGPH